MDAKITYKVAKLVSYLRKRSERIIGYTPYSINFNILNCTAVSEKPQKINVLEKTILNLITNNVVSKNILASVLGLSTQDVAEIDILDQELDYLKNTAKLIEGKQTNLSLTRDGQLFVKTGVLTRRFNGKFTLYVDETFPKFTDLDKCFNKEFAPNSQPLSDKSTNLKLSQVKHLAESQSSHVQKKDKGIEIVSYSINNKSKSKLDVLVCFLQSMRDNSVRTIVYVIEQDRIVDELSPYFEINQSLKQDLLKSCISANIAAENAVEVETGEKTKEQIEAERKAIEEEDQQQGNIVNSKISVGSILGSLEFENELHEIFESRNNQEIWLVSPWIRNYAFLQVREPMIRKFLEQGGSIFIGYSEPEIEGEEMVNPDAMKMLKQMDKRYDRFYFCELPKFHTKNVIEYRKGSVNLYTGSFNVLSFTVDGTEKFYRQEEMTIANHNAAKQNRIKYMELFFSKYSNTYKELLRQNHNNERINASKLVYLKSLPELKEQFDELDKVDSNNCLAYESSKELTDNDFLKISQSLLKIPFTDENEVVQAVVASIFFCYSYYKEQNNEDGMNQTLSTLYSLAGRNSFFKKCRISLRKSKQSKNKSILNVLLRGVNYEFSDISIPVKAFKIYSKYKENILFKEEGYKPAKIVLRDILYNSNKFFNKNM